MKFQILIELNVDQAVKSDILSQMVPATQKFGELFNPISMAELMHIQLSSTDEPIKIVKTSGVLEIGNVKLDTQKQVLTVNDNEVYITPLEFKLLSTLMSNKGQVQSRESLLTNVWGVHPESNTRTVDVHVKRLRDKLGVSNSIIHTVSGVGYIIK